LRNLGYTREAMRGMTPLDLKPEFTEESFRQTILPLLRHEQEQLFFNTVHRRADGSLYPVEVHLQLVELEGQRVFLAMILDITERKLAEEEQRKAQRLLSISQRLAHIGSWETEISTGKLSWSDEMYRILGFPAVSPMYLDLALSVFPPDELVRFNQAIASALQGDVPYNIDYTIIRHDGQVRIIHDEGEVIRDEHGQAIWMFGTTQDITERRHAEDALRESEAKQGKMVANIGDVIVIIDQNGINRYKSPNIEKWFGWRPEEVIGFSAWENIHPDELNSVQKIFGALLGEPNATGTTECRYRCKDGSYKWIEFTGANLLHDPDIRGILGNYHDITERKQADEKLRHVARLYALLSQINQAIVRIPEQDELFRTICQVAIEFGQFRMAWVGLTDEANDRIIPVAHAGQEDGYLDMIHISTEDVPTGRGPTGSAFREGKIMTSNDIATDPWMLPWRDEALNRGYRSSAAVLLSRNGKPVGTFTLYAPEPGFFTAEEQKLLQEIGEDISYALDAMDSEIDRKQSELKLQGKNEEFKIQNEELIIAKEHAEESDRLKSAFLANMSHEVRTPLNSIIGFSELLADSDFEKEQKDEFIQHIITSGNNLLSIISDIMDISKMESGEITIRNKQINVRKFISTVKEKFSSQAENKKLELKLTLPDNDEETAVFADSDRLRQVFNNLMSNAIKFTANGSIEIGYHSMGTMVKFYVKDTGIGIPAEYHKVIFERFRQVEAEKTRKFGGNGLGLAITKNLVELMGGEIWIESESGKGSTFYFTIPCNRYPELKS
jgi:PAS domain S-box-containing protein